MVASVNKVVAALPPNIPHQQKIAPVSKHNATQALANQKQFSFGEEQAVPLSEIKERNFNEDQSSFNLANSKSGLSPDAAANTSERDSYRFKIEKVPGNLDKSPSIIADKGGNETPRMGQSPFKEFATPGPQMNPQYSASNQTSAGKVVYPTPAAVVTDKRVTQQEKKEGLDDSFKSLNISANAQVSGGQHADEGATAPPLCGVVGSKAKPLQQLAAVRAQKHQLADTECSPHLYDEFLNCNSYLYKMQEKEDSEAISSDGEFNEFKDFELLDQADSRFVQDEYQKLVQQKYGEVDSKQARAYLGGRYIDEALEAQASNIVEQKAKSSKYFSKRLVTANAGYVVPRWASDMENLQKIAVQ